MNPFASHSSAIHLLRQPRVRDLAWVILAPPLLADPALNQRHPLQASTWAAQPELLLAWLQQQDADPTALLGWLAQRPVQRLGLYYERLWQFALQQAPGVELLAANLPVREGGHTLGEFDLLLCDGEGLHHLELAVKFYLAHDAHHSVDPAAWLGPGSHDRLDLKLAQMRGPQLALSRTTAARSLLGARGLSEPQPALWLGGYLFEPWPEGCHGPALAAPDHLRGSWLHQHAWPARRQAAADACWYQLSRLDWLAPASLQQAPTAQEDFTHGNRPERPLLLARLQETPDGRWEEVERLFVVPDRWPEMTTSAD
jgi:hypothetical protein